MTRLSLIVVLVLACAAAVHPWFSPGHAMSWSLAAFGVVLFFAIHFGFSLFDARVEDYRQADE